MRKKQSLLFLFVSLVPAVWSHSWVEQLTVIAPNGTFVGNPGYARGNVLRNSSGFRDPSMVNLIPPIGRANNSILPTDLMCKSTQQTANQTAGSPRLQAAAGAAIALRYQENGHVTLPQNQPGKPPNRGTVYVYGTTDPKPDDTLLGVHKVWNENGTGGDGRGVLLSVQNFDDGRCYQVNSGTISTQRQAEFPHQANELMGSNLWCQQDIALPFLVTPGHPYTLYWVWDWPTAPHVDPNLPNGKNETYTTCIDVDIVNGDSSTTDHMESKYIENQPLDQAAIPSEFNQLYRPSPPSSIVGAPSSTESSLPSGTPVYAPSPIPSGTITSNLQTTTEYITVTVTAPAQECTRVIYPVNDRNTFMKKSSKFLFHRMPQL